MVHRADSGRGLPEATRRCKVKLEVEDSARDEFQQPLNKRAKISYSLFNQEWETGSSSTFLEPAQCNPLEEPSPLGLHLRKSPSLLDLIQMRLSQENSASTGASNCENLNAMKKKDVKSLGGAAATEKLKASNFPVSLLRIGDWECVSRYEGDLVAKCYFAKHKLVWEVLDCGLKNKIEIQWSDITAIKATFPENAPATLDIVLARQPLFFKETNPQPRKHTLWQATADFTGGQASMHRRHFLECPQGLLNKHFEKLIQCDPRLNLLSQQPEIALDSPYFETKTSIFEDPDELKPHDFDHLGDEYVSRFPGFHGAGSPCTSQSTSSITEIQDKVYKTPEAAPSATASSSVDFGGVEETGGSERKELKSPVAFSQFKVPGLRSSMSVSDLVNHIGNRISEQMTAGHPIFSPKGEEGSCSKDMLEEITQYLLSDSQFQSASDEQCLMSRVNSLCCLLQKDATAVQNWQIKSEDETSFEQKFEPRSSVEAQGSLLGSQLECKQQPPAMSRKDSLGDLLLHLPRIASLPQFLFNISEENGNQAR